MPQQRHSGNKYILKSVKRKVFNVTSGGAEAQQRYTQTQRFMRQIAKHCKPKV